MTDFHFIRPLWLLALFPAAAIVVLNARRTDTRRIFRNLVAEHLLPYVVSDASARGGLRPLGLLGIVLVLTTLSMAGPTWVREPAPFADNTRALVIAVEVSPTMAARDVQPSRLDRAAQKVKDLLALRKGAKTALIAYAETAHLVMPLTEDAGLIAGFAGELSPDIMPSEGDVPDKAVSLALAQLKSSGLAGSILLVTDGVPPEALPLIAKKNNGASRVHVYGIGAGPEAVILPDSPPAPPLDPNNIEKAAEAGKGSPVLVTADDTDVKQLARIIETRFSPALNPEGGERWRDFGFWLVPLIAVLGLWWFRPGWVIRFGKSGPLGILAILFVVLMESASQAEPPEKGISASDKTEVHHTERPETHPSMFVKLMDTRFMGFFFSDDQRAQYFYNSGVYEKAAQLFTEPARQGSAWYKAGNFERAAASFGRMSTPEGAFNRGNALVFMGDYTAAIKSYETALEQRPDWTAAIENRDIAKARLKAKQVSPDEHQQGKHYTPDDIVLDDKAKNRNQGEKEQVDGAGDSMGDAEMRAIWLRRMETAPADFLKRKFAYQNAMADEQ